MTGSRREFLGSAITATALANLLSAAASPALAGEQTGGSAPSGLPEFDSHDYWNRFFAPVEHSPAKSLSQSVKPKLDVTERQVQFLHSGPSGLRYAEDIDENELPDFAGDVQVTVSLGQFRPGIADQALLKNAKNSQFRVDCTQTKPYLEIVAPLAWCAIASLRPDVAGKLPSLQTLGFASPNATTGVTKILLPQGSGKMAVNVYYTKGASLFDKFLKDAFEGLEGLAPVMNFPAASVTAMKTFSLVLGKLEERAAFLMNSSLTDVVASKNALLDPERAVSYLHLVSGDYVLVPTAHTGELKGHLPNLQLEQGYLVDKNASKSDPLTARKDQVAPGVTYATLKVAINEAPVSAPSGAAAGQGGASGSSPTKAASKRR